MNYSIVKLIFFTAVISVSLASSCPNRHCFTTLNNRNETVLDCVQGSDDNITVKCFYFADSNKIILATADSSYVTVDEIAPGALSRLISGLIVDKIYIHKLQFKTLSKEDFEGLSNVSEMRIENPKTMAPDTFMTLATRDKFFVLTVSCGKENSESSFDSLLLMSNKWVLFTQNCYRKFSCDYFKCNSRPKSATSRISSSNNLTGKSYRLSSQQCRVSMSCVNDHSTTSQPITTNSQTIKSSLVVTSTIRPAVSAQHAADTSYDSLMYIVLVITSINSLVILCVLVFLVIWWSRLSTSTSNNKHTIVLDDDDDDDKTYQ